MKLKDLSKKDKRIVERARSMILKQGEYGLHHISSVIQSEQDNVFTGLHISAQIGSRSVCAESAAVAEGLKNGMNKIKRVVAVRHKFDGEKNTEVVSPCGGCRELIYQNGSDALVVVKNPGGLKLAPITELLPFPFQRRKNIES